MKTKIWMYGLLVAFWAVIAVAVVSAGEGKEITLYRNPRITLAVTDTIVDSVVNQTVTIGVVTAKGLRVNGAAFATYLPILAAAGNVYFDTSVMQILSHPAGFAVTTKTRSATVCRITVTGGHFDSLLGTIMAATDSMTLDFDSTGKTRVHLVGTCDSAINATVVALRLTQATSTADSFYVGWTVIPKAYHATITDYADSVATHVELDTTWGNRSFDSLFMHTQRTHPVTGWTFHGLKRGGHITDTVYTGGWVTTPAAYRYSFLMWCPIYSELESTMLNIAIQTRHSGHDSATVMSVCNLVLTAKNYDSSTGAWVHFGQQADGDTTKAKGGFFGDQFRAVVTATDSNSLPAVYGQIDRWEVVTKVKLLY